MGQFQKLIVVNQRMLSGVRARVMSRMTLRRLSWRAECQKRLFGVTRRRMADFYSEEEEEDDNGTKQLRVCASQCLGLIMTHRITGNSSSQ